jgi:tripartite-type tricarboxylate transporter receptor subunit TctC
VRRFAFAACFVAASVAAQAQPFGPVTILVGYGAWQSAESANDPARSGNQPLSSEPAFDQAARLYAAHLPRFLPGAPAVEVRLAPGAGGLVAARRLIAARPADGATLGLLGAQPLFDALLDESFDPRALVWIGARQRDDDVCIVRSDGPVARIEDARRREAFVAALTPRSRSAVYPRALTLLANLKFRLIAGYSSGFEISRALETGETDVWCGWSIQTLRARYPDMLRQGKVKLLAQFSRAPSLQVPRASDLPEAPAAREAMAHIERGTRFEAFALAAAASAGDRRIAVLREAYDAMLRDSEFLAAAARQGVSVDPVSGGELQAEADALRAATPAARALLRAVLRPD